MLKISSDLDIVQDTINSCNTVYASVNSDLSVNNLMKSAFTVIDGEFTLEMTHKSVEEPERFGHMYEWNRIGDPNYKLWKQQLRGLGKSRTITFNFVASKFSVPVTPKLKEVGVQQNHVFVWKAMVFEYGLPVKISPKLAKALVFEAKDNGSNISHHSNVKRWLRGDIIYFKGTIAISHAGNSEMAGSFTEEYVEWMNSGIPQQKVQEVLGKSTQEVIKTTLLSKIKSLTLGKKKDKNIAIKPVGLDPSFKRTLEKAINTNYIRAAATRRVESIDAE